MPCHCVQKICLTKRRLAERLNLLRLTRILGDEESWSDEPDEEHGPQLEAEGSNDEDYSSGDEFVEEMVSFRPDKIFLLQLVRICRSESHRCHRIVS